MIVDFLIGGVQKCGTTALDQYLRSHPNVEMSRVKEVHFFDQEAGIDWSNPDYSCLHDMYSDNAKGIKGESTPATLYWTPAYRRIREYNPNMLFIFLFRHPTDRAWSHWKMARAAGREPLTFSQAIREGRERVHSGDEIPGFSRWLSYVERGFYFSQVRQLCNEFPKENMLFLRQSDLRLQRAELLKKTADFLQLAPFPEISPLEMNVSDTSPNKMSIEDREYLDQLYRSDLENFESFTGISLQRNVAS